MPCSLARLVLLPLAAGEAGSYATVLLTDIFIAALLAASALCALSGESQPQYLASSLLLGAGWNLLLLAGTVGDPPDSAVFVFDCESTEPIEAFVRQDPYFVHGLVAGHTIRPWNTVVGKDAKTPVRPA